jgi:hypothetical protein
MDEKHYLHAQSSWIAAHYLYKISNPLILQKIFQIPPWRQFKGCSISQFSNWAWILKMVCHLLLLVLLTALVTLFNYQWSGYQRAAAAISCNYFLPNERFCDFDNCIASSTSKQPPLDIYSCTLYKVC